MERETKKVLIVGAGCFGLSTAFYLLHDGHDPVTPELASQGQKSRYQVTIIDSSDSVPAIDSASYDLNKIVRTSYSDKFYTALAKEAIGVWKAGNVCGSNTYHEPVRGSYDPRCSKKSVHNLTTFPRIDLVF
ncbi:hypothetical protein FS842_007709 [Serendipita sp. 407]|nr:hypothetical protein FS842_007709 [Serendipita sp. 407]